jgi:thiamine pyrophosphate-dependent acetolactate synthase large subunit-like protein
LPDEHYITSHDTNHAARYVGSQGEIGKGSFQELNQVEAVRQFCKYAGRATSVRDIGPIITAAVKASFSKLDSLVWQGLQQDFNIILTALC